MSMKMNLYFAFPYWGKCYLARRFARQEDKWRFGPYFEKVRREIRSRNGWSWDHFRRYQHEQLVRVVRASAYHVTYYRQLFGSLQMEPEDFKSIEDLTKLPILERPALTAAPEAFVDERLRKASLCTIHTSGSTGTPAKLYKDAKSFSRWFAYIEERHHAMAKVHRRRNPSVSIGGSPVTRPGREKPPFWVENKPWNQLYMSSYHLHPDNLDAYVDEIRQFRPDYIEGYPASMAILGRHIGERGLAQIPLKAAFSTSEMLTDEHRHAIQIGFGCRTWNQYGTGEGAIFFAEGPCGRMHMSPEVAHVEVLDGDGSPVRPGQLGHLVTTSLVTTSQPLIRYRTGDIGAIRYDGRCECGFDTPVLVELQGRIDDVVYSVDGRPVSRLSHVPKGVPDIREVQIVQTDVSKFTVRISPLDLTVGVTEQARTMLREKLTDLVGPAEVAFEEFEAIPRGPNGKFRTVLCEIPKRNDCQALSAA
jgi:phenylacetate-CoA ligase